MRGTTNFETPLFFFVFIAPRRLIMRSRCVQDSQIRQYSNCSSNYNFAKYSVSKICVSISTSVCEFYFKVLHQFLKCVEHELDLFKRRCSWNKNQRYAWSSKLYKLMKWKFQSTSWHKKTFNLLKMGKYTNHLRCVTL